MRGRELLVAIVVAVTVAACSHDGAGSTCDPYSDDACSVGPKSNACVTDSDCGDGKCVSGVCQAPPTQSQDSACRNVQCGAGQFCSNGMCLNANASCKPADPACIYIPHGAFEPPTHAWWWPWVTPDGPDAAPGKDYVRPDLEDPDSTQVMSTPVVIRLHKDDPEPAVVFNSFSPYVPSGLEVMGVMRAVHGSDGSPIWSAPKDFWNDLQHAVNGNSSIAAGDCTGTGEVCFVTGGFDPDDESRCVSNFCSRTAGARACTQDADCFQYSHQHGGLIAFDAKGDALWVNREAQVWWGGPSIARLLGPTGPAQIVVGNGVYDGATGKTLCPQSLAPLDQVSGNGDGPLSVVADVDLDGTPEILTGNQAYKLLADASSPTGYTCKPMYGDGVKVTAGTCPGSANKVCNDGFPAVANFAGYGAKMGLNPSDPHPQIVVVSHGYLRIHDWTGGMLLDPVRLPGNSSLCNAEFNQGGAPTIADFDGDGLPEIGVSSQGAYSVWKPGVGFIWSSPTFDCSSYTGSSVFDFEGKGQATVVYSDQCFFRVFDGKAGTPLIQEKNASCTAYEMPIVADIDGSGRAKVLVPNNNICNYPCDWPEGRTGQLASRYVGLKALKSPSDKWVNTRSVWNQHTYHVSNVNTDGTLPYPEPNSWAPGQTNTYRQNVQGQGVFSAPDLSICDVQIDMTNCLTSSATVTTTVYNGGANQVAPGVVVTFYVQLSDGSQAKIGTASTQTKLAPGASEKVQIQWPAPPQRQNVTVRAVVDEAQAIGECHYDNNTTVSTPVRCGPLG